jgi:hypothetical protein
MASYRKQYAAALIANKAHTSKSAAALKAIAKKMNHFKKVYGAALKAKKETTDAHNKLMKQNAMTNAALKANNAKLANYYKLYAA